MTYTVSNFLIDKTVQQHSLRSKDIIDYYPNLIQKNILSYLHRNALKIRKKLGKDIKLKVKHFAESGKITKDEMHKIFLNIKKKKKSSDEIMELFMRKNMNREIFKDLLIQKKITDINWAQFRQTAQSMKDNQLNKRIVLSKLNGYLLQHITYENKILKKYFKDFLS